MLWLQSKILKLCLKQSTRGWGWAFNNRCHQTGRSSVLRRSDDLSGKLTYPSSAAPAGGDSCTREAPGLGSSPSEPHSPSANTLSCMLVVGAGFGPKTVVRLEGQLHCVVVHVLARPTAFKRDLFKDPAYSCD